MIRQWRLLDCSASAISVNFQTSIFLNNTPGVRLPRNRSSKSGDGFAFFLSRSAPCRLFAACILSLRKQIKMRSPDLCNNRSPPPVHACSIFSCARTCWLKCSTVVASTLRQLHCVHNVDFAHHDFFPSCNGNYFRCNISPSSNWHSSMITWLFASEIGHPVNCAPAIQMTAIPIRPPLH